jgi:hypothetical protein
MEGQMSEPRQKGYRGRPAPDDYVEFVHTGVRAKGEFECTACGLRILAMQSLPVCERCGGTLWERSPWSPFSDLLARINSERAL